MSTGARRNGWGPAVRAVCVGAVVLLGVTAVPAQAAPQVPPAAAAKGAAAKGGTERVSLAPGGGQANGGSYASALSAEGRYAVFISDASDLVPGDTNASADVFVRDLWTGRTERVNVSTEGAQAVGYSYDAVISGNGRFVAFTSSAGNLVAGDANGSEDVFVHDRRTGRTERVSAGPAQGGAQEARDSFMASISWDGRYVAFGSSRSDLVPGDTNGVADVFVSDRWTGGLRRVSVGEAGVQADRASTRPVISADGHTVGFISKATNLVPATGPETGGGAEGVAAAKADTADASDASDAFAGTADARHAGGAELTRPRFYPFFLHDLRSGRTTGGSLATDGRPVGVTSASLSPEGRFVVFTVFADGTVPGDTNRLLDVFVRDLWLGTTKLVSGGADGAQANGSSYDGVISAGGRWVHFTSDASNLVAGDTNQLDDVYRHDLWTGRTERLSVAPDGTQNPSGATGPVIDALGTTVLFQAEDGTLVPGDTNGVTDVFVRRLPLF
ncbi:TolB family protein [Kitasatospora sp. NPDC004240]